MQKFKSAIYLLLETEKRVNEQIELLKLKNKEQSIVIKDSSKLSDSELEKFNAFEVLDVVE